MNLEPVRKTHPAFAPRAIIAGKYRIEREIAAGGVGVVVLATHLELGQPVALKYLQPRLLHDADLVERFKREARLAAALRSEHVVRIHDVGAIADGTPYMVMEYLEGRDLGAVILEGPTSFADARTWLTQACEALTEAHARGIVHRDLKPENLFLTRRGSRTVLKVVDFGISKSAPEDERRAHRITRADDRFGTPLYMSPEQLQSSKDVDARTDIWALGVVLYELLSGSAPFEGDSLPKLISNVLTAKPVPLRSRVRSVSPAVEALVLRCLARDPAERPASAGVLADLLAAVEPAPTTTATPNLAWTPAALPVLETVADPEDLTPFLTPFLTSPGPPRSVRRKVGIGVVAIAAAAAAVITGIVAFRPSPTVSTASSGLVANVVTSPPSSARAIPPPPPVPPFIDGGELGEAPVRTPAAAPSAPAARAAVAPSPAAPIPAAPAQPRRARTSHLSGDYAEFGDRR